MASIFTYQEEPPRVHSPWSTSGSVTPRGDGKLSQTRPVSNGSNVTAITRLEPERHDGPTEYKLHLLLRSRRSHLNAFHVDVLGRSLSDVSGVRTPVQQSSHSRQARLQQLTTQLLWRLQQSSPFHSSSNADLVLPLLPEATPRLGVPDRPSKLLPGLEESQGALYEIGVADDGTLVGLIEEELEESLNNLRAMAASLGCVVDILRRVLVGQNGRQSDEQDQLLLENKIIKLWVAEVLVRPETKSPRIPPIEETSAMNNPLDRPINTENTRQEPKRNIEQLRIAVTGPTTAGKSSLVGSLTTSTLDNGRGKSRLSLLKHRHEIASGITSSVAQEMLGYREAPSGSQTVINYATGNVSSWPDIHNLASRLVFLSDSPGLPRYAKSTFRTLISWAPSWTLVCVAADSDDIAPLSNSNGGQRPVSQETIDLPLLHLNTCLDLDLPLVVVITKLDVATKSGLKAVLSKILSTIKTAGRLPALLAAPSNAVSHQDENFDVAAELARVNIKEQTEITALIRRIEASGSTAIVPIVLTSAVTGVGIGKLHAMLRGLPTVDTTKQRSGPTSSPHVEALFRVDEIFAIPPSKVYSEGKEEHSADQGIVLCGHLAAGRLAIGDQLRLGPFKLESEPSSEEDTPQTPRSASYCLDSARQPISRASSGLFSRSLQIEQRRLPTTLLDAQSTFIDVHVVSLRSLRLPVRSMQAGETGTVGIQPVTQNESAPLSRARKGMVLTSAASDNMFGYRSFSATFAASAFINANSPTLILGGHAIVYVNSMRAAVRVTALALDENNTQTEPSSPTEVFNFDGDDQDNDAADHSMSDREARIMFRFVGPMEWMEVGDKVLVVPTVTAAGPVTGSSVSFNGLSGFVGRICDVFI